MKFITALALGAGLVCSGVAEEEGKKCTTSCKTSKCCESKDMKKKTLVEIASCKDDFSTLVAAVKAADLAEALSGEGPFTVFAPTNAAFEKLPEGTVEDLLKPENKEKLVTILKYHVVSGKVMAADVKSGDVKTLQGSDLTIKAEEGKVMIDEATVIKTDVEGSNGVIHVIDTVIMP